MRTRFRKTLCVMVAVMIGLTSAVAESYRFTARGTVKRITKTSGELHEILLAHEPIPAYRDQSGQVVGMAAMTMPFYASSEKATAIKSGEKVEITVESEVGKPATEKVVEVRKLDSP